MSVQNLQKLELKIGIVGAGPSGSLLAYLLAKKGFKHITLLERKSSVDRKVCGEYLCPKGVELLDKLELTQKIAYDFQQLNGMILVSPDNDVIPTYFPKPTDKEHGLSLNRKIFDQRLLNLACAENIQYFHEKTLTQILKNKINGLTQYLITFQDESEMAFDLLIAADGRQSKIGHLLGHIKNINTKRSAIHCYLPRLCDKGLRLGEMHILNAESYCGLDPISDDEVNFSIVCDSHLLKKTSPMNLINSSISKSLRLSKLFSPISNDCEIKIVSTLKNKNNFIAGDSLAYVGDAAGFIDPLTGEGIYNALFSSSLLAEELSQTQNINFALKKYKLKKRILSFEKTILNHFFQYLIKKPILVKWTVNFLKKSEKRANIFIGIIGNIYNPFYGFIKMLKA